MGGSVKIWRGTDGDTAPVRMECDVFGWPNRTATGETMYENTYFRTEAEAWKSIIASVEAGVKLAGSRVLDLQEKLRSAQEQAGEAAADYVKAQDGYRHWRQKHEAALKASKAQSDQ